MRLEGLAPSQLAVLKAIRREGPISRVELARAVSLGGATITQIMNHLSRRGLVIEERLSPNGKGRPRLVLSIDPAAATVLGASPGPSGELELSLVDLGGGLLRRAGYQLSRHEAVASLTEEIARAVQRFIADGPVATPPISSLALALPGMIQNPEGLVHWVPTMRAETTPVRQMLSAALDLPVMIENDIECMARAEHWFGAQDPGPDFTIIMVGFAVGSAEYVGGVPRIGANGFNSEFAHVKTAWGEEARLCFCGARGCLNTYASAAGIVRGSLPVSERVDMDQTALEAAFRALTTPEGARKNNARAAFQVAGLHLGVALANLVNSRDPGRVLVRCTEPEIADLIREPLMSAFEDNCLGILRERTHLDIGEVEEGWRWKGAAALALEQMYLGENRRQQGGA